MENHACEVDILSAQMRFYSWTQNHTELNVLCWTAH